MDVQRAIVVDDLAADRQLAAIVLQLAGWTVYPAHHSQEAERIIAEVCAAGQADGTLIVTDLYMPNDPAWRASDQPAVAGAQFALRLRTRMERGALPRMPIVALTALTAVEIHATALAFGCDAVLPKPATPELAQDIRRALARLHDEDADPLGTSAILGLLRRQLAAALAPEAPPAPRLTEQDITRALLAYQRRGVVGLGESALGGALAPHLAGMTQRGEHVYTFLMRALDEIMRLGVSESIAILQGELVGQLSVADQCAALGISRSEFYRRRREATAVLLDLLTRHLA